MHSARRFRWFPSCADDIFGLRYPHRYQATPVAGHGILQEAKPWITASQQEDPTVDARRLLRALAMVGQGSLMIHGWDRH